MINPFRFSYYRPMSSSYYPPSSPYYGYPNHYGNVGQVNSSAKSYPQTYPNRYPGNRDPYFNEPSTQNGEQDSYSSPEKSRTSSHASCSTTSSSAKDSTNSEEEEKENRSFIDSFFSFLPTSIGPLSFHPEALTDHNRPIFELMGIELFLDDIIIVCLLIFLYQEEVEDQMLYLALVMLLFS